MDLQVFTATAKGLFSRSPKSRLLLPGLLTLLMAPALTAQTQPAKEMRLAAPLALSGIAAQHSENIRKGIELAKEDLTRQGWKIELAFEDSGAEAAGVITSVKYLLSRGYRLFIGPTWSYMIAAAKPLFEQSGALAFSPITSSEITAGPSPNVFHGTPKHSYVQPVVQKWLLQNKIRKMAIITSQTGWGELHRSIFENAAKAEDVQMVPFFSYGLNEEEDVVRIFVSRILAQRPDAILADLNRAGAAVLLRRLEESHYSPRILGVQKLQEAFDHKLVLMREDTPCVAVFVLPLAPAFIEKYEKAYGEKPGMFADLAYDGVMIFAQAISHTDGSTAAVQKYLHSELEYQGVAGKFEFDADGNVRRAGWEIRELNPFCS